jgi:hypothetical protein
MNRDSWATIRTDQEHGLFKEVITSPGGHTGEIAMAPEVLEEWKNMSTEDKVAFERRLLWKLDFRLVPWLSLLYLLSFLDRTNIGNAKLQGVKTVSEDWI